MEWQQVASNWSAFAEAISDRWPRAEDDDVLAIDGNRAEFEAYLSRVHDLTRAEAREEVAAWLEGAIPADVVMSEEHDEASIAASSQHIPAGEDVYAEDGDFGDDRVEPRPIGRSDGS